MLKAGGEGTRRVEGRDKEQRRGLASVSTSCPKGYRWHGASKKWYGRILVQYNAVQYSTVQYSIVQYSTVQYSTVQYSTVQYSTVQYSTVQYSTVQYSAVRYGAVQCSIVQYTQSAQISATTKRSVAAKRTGLRQYQAAVGRVVKVLAPSSKGRRFKPH